MGRLVHTGGWVWPYVAKCQGDEGKLGLLMVTELRNMQGMVMEGEIIRERKEEKILELKFFKDLLCLNIKEPQNRRAREERTEDIIHKQEICS